jgi:serine/threonine-protein kinase RsbW
MLKIKHTAELCNLRAFKDALNEYLRKHQISDARIADVELAIEELIVNVMNYSYPDSTDTVELLCEKDENNLIFRILDEGIPFDPTKSPDPELDAPIKERSKGGMGIYLAKSLVDKMSYRRDGNKNILTVRLTMERD